MNRHGWKKGAKQMALVDPGAEIGDADWYPTPEWCVTGLLDVAPPPNALVLEPAAGDGVLVRILRERGYQVRACDIRPRVMPELRKLCPAEWGDWLRFSDPERGYPELLKLCGQLEHTSILTNPPYAIAAPFVGQALLTPSPWCGFLLRLDVLGSRPWSTVFGYDPLKDPRDRWKPRQPGTLTPPTTLVNMRRRPSFSGDGQTSMNNYAWLVWEVGATPIDMRPIG